MRRRLILAASLLFVALTQQASASLEVTGVWETGVWDTTVWADGVWREGPPPAPEGRPILRDTERDILRDIDREI